MNNLKRIEMEGYFKDEKCGRGGCDGIIQEKDIEGGCSCHINPPCDYCMTPKHYCPKCGYDEREEVDEYNRKESEYWKEYHQRPEVIEEKRQQEETERVFYSMYRGETPVDKYTARQKSHTHFSQIIYGVHPNLSRQEITEKVIGTFGGRFTRFNTYSFEFIAYTN